MTCSTACNSGKFAWSGVGIGEGTALKGITFRLSDFFFNKGLEHESGFFTATPRTKMFYDFSDTWYNIALHLQQPLLVLGHTAASCVCAWSWISRLVMLYDFIKEKVLYKAVNVSLHPTFSILHISLYGTDQDFIVCGKSPIFCRVSSQPNGLSNAK